MDRTHLSLEQCLQILFDAGFHPEIAMPEFLFPQALKHFSAVKNDWAFGGHDIYISPLDCGQFERLNFGYNVNNNVRSDLTLTVMKGSKIGALIRVDKGDPSKDGSWYQFTLVSNIVDSIRDGAINEAPVEAYAFEPENRIMTQLQA